MLVQQYFKQLKNVDLFQEIREEDYPSMLGCVGAYVKEYDKDEIISLIESERRLIGIVLSGNVHMVQEDLWGNRAILLDVTKNHMFGETFACGGANTNNISFIAVEKSVILVLPFERIMSTCASACGHHQKVIMNMVTLIARKNVDLMSKIDVISKNTLREKIISFLTKQIGNQYPDLSNAAEFPIQIEISLGRQQMAEYLHADRSAVFRELNRMKEEGLIDFEKKKFFIVKELE